MNQAGDEAVRADVAALPGWLQRIDDWIAEGVLGSDPPNAADLQIAASLRLAMTLDDLRPAIESRPAGEMARRAVPDFPGRAAPVLPPGWLEPLRRAEQPAGSG
jgi:glutathione S-transferase